MAKPKTTPTTKTTETKENSTVKGSVTPTNSKALDFITPEEGLEYIISNAKAKFNETIDVVFSLNLNAKKYPEHNLKGFMLLPHPQIKPHKICVLTERHLLEIEKLNPFMSGGKDLIDEINKTQEVKFDLLLATSEVMGHLSRLGKLLGPKKLMPSKKLGTLSDNIVRDYKAWMNGRMLFHTDANGNLHLSIGKVKDKFEHLLSNLNFTFQFIHKLRPTNVKGKYLKAVSLTSTMGPGIKLTVK